jgi:uncharacterized protein (DUF983 family)
MDEPSGPQPAPPPPAPQEPVSPRLARASGRPSAGSICPQCGQGKLAYDRMLNLSCPVCDFSEGGCFT